jgi:hypothetical protein
MRVHSVFLLTAALAATAPGWASAQTVGLRSGLQPNAREETVIPAPAPAATEDPYEALGIRAGGFILYPSLTFTGGYTTNAGASASGTGAGFGTIAPELRIQSDWSRHEATLTLRGAYQTFLDNATPDAPTGSADATARIDFANDWTGDLAAGIAYERKNISDPLFPDGADTLPGVTTLSSSAALNGNFGRGTFTVEGSIDRTLHEDTTSGGAPVDQGDRINTVFGSRLRLGYAATASLTPFVEGEVSRRAYDRLVDHNGLQRSSLGLAGRAGIAFDRGPLLTGEIAVGTRQEDFDEPALATLHALTIDGSLIWSPMELTTVTFEGSTALNPGADAASSGSVVYDGSVDIAYDWRENFTFDWTAGINHERFQGTGEIDTTYNAGISGTWKINRALRLTAGYVHEWLTSSDPANDYQSDAVQVELRVQR